MRRYISLAVTAIVLGAGTYFALLIGDAVGDDEPPSTQAQAAMNPSMYAHRPKALTVEDSKQIWREKHQKQIDAEIAKQKARKHGTAHRSVARTYPTGPLVVDYERWERLHICEQGNNWYANGGNPADPGHQTFQGGLGMSTVAWQMGVRAAAARGVVLPDSALDASPEQQMQGAQAFYDAHGWGWSCVV